MTVESKCRAGIKPPSDGVAPIGNPKLCLEPEEFTPFVRESIAPGRRKTILEHLETCKDCRSLVATVRSQEYPNGTRRERVRRLLIILGFLGLYGLYHAPDIISRFAKSGFGRSSSTVIPSVVVDEFTLSDEFDARLLGRFGEKNEPFRPFTIAELRSLENDARRAVASGPGIRPTGRLLGRRPTITIDRLDIGVAAKVAVVNDEGHRVFEWIIDPNEERRSAESVTIRWPIEFPELDAGSDFRIVAEVGVGPEMFEISSNISTLDAVRGQVLPTVMSVPHGIIRDDLRSLLDAQFLMRHGLFAEALPLAEEAARLHESSDYVQAVFRAVAAQQGVEIR